MDDGYYSLKDVKRILENHKGREIPVPGPPEYSCVELIISKCVKEWEGPMQVCLERVVNLFQEELEKSRELQYTSQKCFYRLEFD